MIDIEKSMESYISSEGYINDFNNLKNYYSLALDVIPSDEAIRGEILADAYRQLEAMMQFGHEGHVLQEEAE